MNNIHIDLLPPEQRVGAPNPLGLISYIAGFPECRNTWHKRTNEPPPPAHQTSFLPTAAVHAPNSFRSPMVRPRGTTKPQPIPPVCPHVSVFPTIESLNHGLLSLRSCQASRQVDVGSSNRYLDYLTKVAIGEPVSSGIRVAGGARDRENSPPRVSATSKKQWPSYDKALAGAPPNADGTGPSRSHADYWWAFGRPICCHHLNRICQPMIGQMTAPDVASPSADVQKTTFSDDCRQPFSRRRAESRLRLIAKAGQSRLPPQHPSPSYPRAAP